MNSDANLLQALRDSLTLANEAINGYAGSIGNQNQIKTRLEAMKGLLVPATTAFEAAAETYRPVRRDSYNQAVALLEFVLLKYPPDHDVHRSASDLLAKMAGSHSEGSYMSQSRNSKPSIPDRGGRINVLNGLDIYIQPIQGNGNHVSNHGPRTDPPREDAGQRGPDHDDAQGPGHGRPGAVAVAPNNPN